MTTAAAAGVASGGFGGGFRRSFSDDGEESDARSPTRSADPAEAAEKRNGSILSEGIRLNVNSGGQFILETPAVRRDDEFSDYGRWSFADRHKEVNPFKKKGPKGKKGNTFWRRCAKRAVVDPDETPALLKLDLVMLLAMAFVAIMTPVEVSMLEVRINAVFVVNRFVDVVFLFDMALQFFMKYPVKTRYHCYMEDRHSFIARRYLSTWFLVDFVCVLPYDLISLTSNDSAMANLKAIRALRLLRLLKLTRTLKGSRMMRRIEVQMSVSYQHVSLVKFFTMLLLVAHWQACAWCATLRLVDASESRWVDDVDAQVEQSKTTDRPWILYQSSIYFAVYTMTSVGYGDCGPNNILERAVCVVFLLISGVSWAYIIGQVTCIVGNMGQLKQQYHEMLDQVNYMMYDRGIPPGMQRRLRRYFLSTKDVQLHQQQWRLVSELSHGLQGQVAMMTHAVWLEKITFLKGFLEEVGIQDLINEAIQNREVLFWRVPRFVLDISLSLDFRMYASEEYFGKPFTLYILSTGICMREHLRLRVGEAHRSLSATAVWERQLVVRQGAVWGEDFILSDATLLSPFTAMSLSYVEVLLMGRDAFLAICEKHQKEYPELPRAVRRHVVRLAFRRGVIAETRKFRMGRPSAVPNALAGRRTRQGIRTSQASLRRSVCSDQLEADELRDEVDEVLKPIPRRTRQSIAEATRKSIMNELAEVQAITQARMLQTGVDGEDEMVSTSSMLETEMESRGSMISMPDKAAPASLAPQLRALQEDVADLKEVQRQNAEMMRFLAKHEALLAETLRARAFSRGGAGTCRPSDPSPTLR